MNHVNTEQYMCSTLNATYENRGKTAVIIRPVTTDHNSEVLGSPAKLSTEEGLLFSQVER